MIYMVVSLGASPEEKEALQKKIIEELELDYFGLYKNDGVLFVSYGGTSGDLREKLGLGSQVGSGIVIAIQSLFYGGYASKNLWEWIKINGD